MTKNLAQKPIMDPSLQLYLTLSNNQITILYLKIGHLLSIKKIILRKSQTVSLLARQQ